MITTSSAKLARKDGAQKAPAPTCTPTTQTITTSLMQSIHEIGQMSPDWSFSGDDERGDIHDIAQYPAMMVPKMQGLLMRAAHDALGGNMRVLDPFVGSGTTLVEATRRGWFFAGRDINPYAILLSKTKGTSFATYDLPTIENRVLSRILADKSDQIDVHFPRRAKWFRDSVSIQLSRLRRAVMAEQELDVRRLLWCVLAETIRTTSNSRTSTFKLHIREPAELEASPPDAITRFGEKLKDVIQKVRREEVRRQQAYLKPNTDIRVSNIKNATNDEALNASKFHLLITSPPYGDNTTTVPYGQFSYLPLQWIDFDDIEPGLSRLAVSTTHTLDTLSVGGGRRGVKGEEARLIETSQTLCNFLQNVNSSELTLPQRHDILTRALAFTRDLALSVQRSVAHLDRPAISMWTVGNRRLGRLEFPLDAVIQELIKTQGGHVVTTIERRIPSKRMAIKNRISQTMRKEFIIVVAHV